MSRRWDSSSQEAYPLEEVGFAYHVEQFLFQPFMDVFHMGFDVYQHCASSNMLQFPSRIVHEGFESLSECEEPIEVSAVRGVCCTLHDHRAEVWFREEGVPYKVLVLLRSEEQVLGYDVCILGAKSLRNRRVVRIRSGVSGVRRGILVVVCVSAMTTTNGCRGHCIMKSTM